MNRRRARNAIARSCASLSREASGVRRIPPLCEPTSPGLRTPKRGNAAHSRRFATPTAHPRRAESRPRALLASTPTSSQEQRLGAEPQRRLGATRRVARWSPGVAALPRPPLCGRKGPAPRNGVPEGCTHGAGGLLASLRDADPHCRQTGGLAALRPPATICHPSGMNSWATGTRPHPLARMVVFTRCAPPPLATL